MLSIFASSRELSIASYPEGSHPERTELGCSASSMTVTVPLVLKAGPSTRLADACVLLLDAIDEYIRRYPVDPRIRELAPMKFRFRVRALLLLILILGLAFGVATLTVENRRLRVALEAEKLAQASTAQKTYRRLVLDGPDVFGGAPGMSRGRSARRQPAAE
jgi:hypothetical protein